MTLRPVIIDTNVVVSGLLTADPRSPTARILDAMLQGGFPYLISQPLLEEYRAVLLRPRIRKRHGLSEREVDALLTEIVASAMMRAPDPSTSEIPDPGDAHLWALLASEPDARLVTGDRALVENPPPNADVILPAEFCNLLWG
ncbi:MAG: putative toxin-antitoxin system toxin component, PIN family [Planctomycetota bacterium]|nr:MAG: putative toxin-antitoxin system toxin component, PIN family [Planctomycetota bacterium]